MYSNSYCWCSFELKIIKIGLSSHKMYSNNILNFQESTTLVKAYIKKVWKLIVCTSYINLHGLSKAKIILVEDWSEYYLTHYFPYSICRKVNVITCLEFEIANYDATVQYISHYTTRTLLRPGFELTQLSRFLPTKAFGLGVSATQSLLYLSS